MKYRSKPVEIEAWPFNGTYEAAAPILAASDGTVTKALTETVLRIKTLEGEMLAMPGDWIIKGTEGEFYPCKPSVFARKYEAVKETADA